MTEPEQVHAGVRGDQTVINAVHANAQLIVELTQQIDALRSQLEPLPTLDPAQVSGQILDSDAELPSDFCSDSDSCSGDVQQWQEECDRLHRRVLTLEDELDQSQRQNETLAAKLANQSIAAVATSPAESGESLSWEERKQLIMQQMENESLSDLVVGGAATSNESESIHHMSNCDSANVTELVDRLRAEVEARSREVAELRELLDQQSQTCDGGVAIGAAAIAGMIDDDELVQQERQRLQKLQSDWEEKFRAGEIEASLERAKLSRERQEVVRQKVELEVQLDRLQRELKDTGDGPSTRRWLTKLGLTDEVQ